MPSIIPLGEMTSAPAVFVQSTSVNRVLQGGTRFLYEVEDWDRGGDGAVEEEVVSATKAPEPAKTAAAPKAKKTEAPKPAAKTAAPAKAAKTEAHAAPAATKPAAKGGGRRRFEFSEGTSNKFWEVWTEGTNLYTQYGRIGSAGQTTVKNYPDAAAAQKAAEKLIAEKTGKGYAEK